MAPIRHKLQLRGTATTKPDSILKKHIPYKTNQSNEKEQDLLKPIQLHIVALQQKGCPFTPSIASILLLRGRSSVRFGVKAKKVLSTQLKAWNIIFLFLLKVL